MATWTARNRFCARCWRTGKRRSATDTGTRSPRSHNLGTLLQDKGDLDGAEPLLRKALEGYRETLGDQHRDTLTAIP